MLVYRKKARRQTKSHFRQNGHFLHVVALVTKVATAYFWHVYTGLSTTESNKICTESVAKVAVRSKSVSVSQRGYRLVFLGVLWFYLLSWHFSLALWKFWGSYLLSISCSQMEFNTAQTHSSKTLRAHVKSHFRFRLAGSCSDQTW